MQTQSNEKRQRIPARYRYRMIKLCRVVCKPEEATVWIAHYLDGRDLEWIEAKLGRGEGKIEKRLNAADRAIDVAVSNHYHRYQADCPCAGCERVRAGQVLTALRNSVSGKRPQKTPTGQPDENGKVWPLRGPRVTADDLTVPYLDALEGRNRLHVVGQTK